MLPSPPMRADGGNCSLTMERGGLKESWAFEPQRKHILRKKVCFLCVRGFYADYRLGIGAPAKPFRRNGATAEVRKAQPAFRQGNVIDKMLKAYDAKGHPITAEYDFSAEGRRLKALIRAGRNFSMMNALILSAKITACYVKITNRLFTNMTKKTAK